MPFSTNDQHSYLSDTSQQPSRSEIFHSIQQTQPNCDPPDAPIISNPSFEGLVAIIVLGSKIYTMINGIAKLLQAFIQFQKTRKTRQQQKKSSLEH